MKSVFLNAYQSINENPNRSLQLSVRRSILLTFGKIELKIDQENFTNGKKLRAMLALRCVEKIMPLWYLAFPDDHRFDNFIFQIHNYVNTKCDTNHKDEASVLSQLIDDFYCEMENICHKPEFSMLTLVWGALTHAAAVALVDEEILRPSFEGANDEDLDSFTWDTAYMSCMLYENAFGNDEETVRFFRYGFWKWYIDEAVKLYHEFCA